MGGLVCAGTQLAQLMPRRPPSVISKFRGIAAIKLVDTAEGSGVLEGLGFYVDDTRSRGMVAPFTYVRVRLVEADSLKVVGEGTARQSSSSPVRRPILQARIPSTR
ncbi:hypothetical protein ACN9MZ_21500 [Pseudoduganella sp. S-14]|jgi:hypothetical protein|uniref:hypothetical protein n=1 Tax=Pseudoduganella sp. S-14 TaxID=3404065 RepID=UPI003CEA9FA7